MKIKASQLGQALNRRMLRSLSHAGLEQVLVSQAKRRIDNSGDSEERYPALWADTRSFISNRDDSKGQKLDRKFSRRLKSIVVTQSYRAGGRPLRDTSQHIYQRLSGTHVLVQGERLVVALRGPILAAFHQGQRGNPIAYKTKGPNFIPLNRRAARVHRKGANPKDEGLVQGRDYVMAWRGVTAPRRAIFNLPPEDSREIHSTTKRALARLGA